MNYTIASDRLEVGSKKKGDQVAEKELLDARCNIEALVAGGHLVSTQAAKTTPTTEGGVE